MNIRRTALIIVLASASCKSVFGDGTLSVTLTSSDLSAVQQGGHVTIGVELVGLSPGTTLDSLAATVSFDGSLFGVPNITPGPIVPAPLATPLDLLIATDAGFADVAFLTLDTYSERQIRENGRFFSFDVTSTKLGSGTFHIEFLGATQFNPDDPDSPVVRALQGSADLPFTIVAVPEPFTAIYCWLVLIPVWMLVRPRSP